MIDERKIKCFACHVEGLIAVYDLQRDVYFCPECCRLLNHEPPYSNEELVVLLTHLINEVSASSKRQLYGYP